MVKGATTSHIKIDIGGGVIVTASITNDAVDELKLTKDLNLLNRLEVQIAGSC